MEMYVCVFISFLTSLAPSDSLSPFFTIHQLSSDPLTATASWIPSFLPSIHLPLFLLPGSIQYVTLFSHLLSVKLNVSVLYSFILYYTKHMRSVVPMAMKLSMLVLGQQRRVDLQVETKVHIS
jgi:hypothetical protein